MNWNVGDFAILSPSLGFPEHTGKIVEILSPLRRAWLSDENGKCFEADAYHIDIDGNRNWNALPIELHPLPQESETTTWDECIFKPKELVT